MSECTQKRIMSAISLAVNLCVCFLMAAGFRSSLDGEWRTAAMLDTGAVLLLLGEKIALWIKDASL